MTDRTAPHPRIARGFTLIELLVVIIIIAILLGIGLTVGARVANSGRKIQTVSTIQQLDQVLEEYMNDRGTLPPALGVDPRYDSIQGRGRRYIPIADGVTTLRGGDGSNAAPNESINTVGYFLRSVSETTGARSLIEQISPTPSLYSPTKGAREAGFSGGNFQGGSAASPDQISVPTVFDAFRVKNDELGPSSESVLSARVNDRFANPIRFVHPAFDGEIVRGDTRGTGTPGSFIRVDGAFPNIVEPLDANQGAPYQIEEIRRNFLTQEDRESWNGPGPALGDSDGGVCPGGTPYFYSPGPDGDPSTLDDNVYSTIPQFQPGATRAPAGS